jgi:hypothetical protein
MSITASAASSLLDSLELSLDNVMLCPACLGSIAVELDHGDAHSLREALRMFVPLLWEEGLETVVRDALDRARREGVPGATEALLTVARYADRAVIVEAIVLRLARELSRRVNRVEVGERMD